MFCNSIFSLILYEYIFETLTENLIKKYKSLIHFAEKEIVCFALTFEILSYGFFERCEFNFLEDLGFSK